jgi:hypothetical protein
MAEENFSLLPIGKQNGRHFDAALGHAVIESL